MYVRPVPLRRALLLDYLLGLGGPFDSEWWDTNFGRAVVLLSHDRRAAHWLAIFGWGNQMSEAWEGLRDAIDLYRIRLAMDSFESTFTLVSGHGSVSGSGGLCGHWGPGYWVGWDLERATFHQENYTAAKPDICLRMDVDLSCGAGRTVHANYELDNGSPAACQDNPAEQCPFHAGFEGDLAVGSSTSGATCSLLASGEMSALVSTMHTASQAGSMSELAASLAAASLGAQSGVMSRYSDGGYGACLDPNHPLGFGNGPVF